MPGVSSKTELYLGSCLGDLHNLSEIKQQLGQNVKIIVRSSNKVFQDADMFDTKGDEERAYVLYHKYFNILQQIKSKPDYKKQKDYFDSLIGKQNQIKAIERAEKLAESLKERYDLKKAKSIADKLSPVSSSSNIASTDVQNGTNVKPETKKTKIEPAPETKAPDAVPGSLKSVELCSLLRDANTRVIVMDVRPASDFNQSHICHTDCISVPEDIITPGSTVNHIQTRLPRESLAIWQQRQNADYIVLLDWKSTLERVTVGSPLKTLKDALHKFDMTTIIKSEPLILEGGYDQWLLLYPTMTTNPHVAKPTDIVLEQPSSPSMLLDFDYPELDENLQHVKPKPPATQTLVDLNNRQDRIDPTLPSDSFPKFDRSLKPSSQKNGNVISSEPGINVKQNNTDVVDGLLNNQTNSTGSTLYPSISGSIKQSVKNINILNDNESKIPKNINLSFRNNLAADLSKSTMQREEQEAQLRDFKAARDGQLERDQEHLQEAEKKLKDLELIKKKEERDVADLMRMKRKLQEEVEGARRKRDDDLEMLKLEEQRRTLALEKAKREEEASKLRMQEVEKLRQERKTLELAKKVQAEEDEEEERLWEASQAEKLRQEELQRLKSEEERLEKERLEKERLAEVDRQKQEDEKRQREAKKLREQEQLRKEEEQKRILKEAQKQDAARIAEEEQKKKELEAKMLQEKQRKIQETAAKEREAAIAKERDDAAKKGGLKESEHPPSKNVPSTMLPSGWEKRLDRATNRYFYIDHNKGQTHWAPPVAQQPSQKPGTYTVKLKDEPSISSSRGLSRSHSSPDIKKQLEEEEARNKKQGPVVNRGSKPTMRPQLIQRPVVYPVRKRDLNPVFGNVGPAQTGLRNLGNTCYMNSTIQCLNNTSPLISYFLNDDYQHDINRESSQGMHGEVVDDFAVIVKALWSQQYRSITPRDLKNVVGKYNPMFAGYQQQDSQEFLTFLLDGLHEGLNEVRKAPDIPEQKNDDLTDADAAHIAWKHHKLLHKSIIIELFQGQLKSSLMCRTCGKKSVTFQAFMFLSLPIPASSRCSLNDCIQEFLRPEMMTGSSKWKCPSCKVERDSQKKIDIWKLPPILLVGLNRFYSEGMWMQKKTTYVDFPLTDLDLSKHILGPRPRNVYNLYGISNHYGTMEGGHYTAFCRNPVNQRWYKFDDQDVYEMARSDVKTSAAFVLYYTSVEMPAPQYKPRL